MAFMILNGQEVALTTQSQETLGTLAQVLLPLIAAKQGLVASLGGVLGQGLQAGLPTTDPRIQACLWLLHEMGVRVMTVAPNGSSGSVDKALSDEERARDTSDPYSAGNMVTGRALATALSNVATRVFMLNGEAREVKLLPREKMDPAMQAVIDMRRLNEPIHLTTTRVLASMIGSGVAKDDERIDAMVSLISDLGVAGITIDTTTSTITFDGPFSQANAVASAYLQGGGIQGVQGTRNRIQQMNSQMQNSAAGAAQQNSLTSAASGSSVPNAQARTTARPKSFVKARRRG